MIKYNKGHSFNHFGIKRIQLTSPEYFWWYKLRIPWCFAASKKPERNKRIKGVMFCQNIIYNWWSPYHELSTSGYICTKYSTKNTRCYECLSPTQIRILRQSEKVCCIGHQYDSLFNKVLDTSPFFQCFGGNFNAICIWSWPVPRKYLYNNKSCLLSRLSSCILSCSFLHK